MNVEHKYFCLHYEILKNKAKNLKTGKQIMLKEWYFVIHQKLLYVKTTCID